MIISFKKKFVFLHCRKTAGTFISSLLYDILDNKDLIVGSLEDIHSIKKIKIFNHREVVKVSNIPCLLKSLYKTLKYKKNLGFLINDFYKQKYYKIYKNPPHMSILKVKENFPETKNFFSFCFVRNPYDYAVSDYLWRINQNTKYKEMKFKEFLKLKVQDSHHDMVPAPKTNWSIYTSNNKISVDFVGRFEKLNEDLRIIFEKLGLDLSLLDKNTDILKKNFSKKNYQEYYSKEEKDLVEKLHYYEIKEFNYKF